MDSNLGNGRPVRSNAGVPFPRYGYENVATAVRVPTTIPPPRIPRNVIRAPSVSSQRSRSSRHRETELELATQVEVNRMEEKYEAKEHSNSMLQIELQNLTELHKQLQERALANPPSTPQEKIELQGLEDRIREGRKELAQSEATLRFAHNSLKRKKKLLEKETALERVRIEEDEDDDDHSQKLSDEEDGGQNEGDDNLGQHEEPATYEDDLLRRWNALKNSPEVTPSLNHVGNPSSQEQFSVIPHPTSAPGMVTIDTLTAACAAAMQGSGKREDNGETRKLLARQSHAKDLPPFSGRAEEWPAFLSAFRRSTGVCGFSDDENLMRLQRALKGEALKAVQCLLISPTGVTRAIQKLELRFGNPELVIRSLIERAKNFPPMKEDRLDTLIDFGTAVSNLFATIQAMDCQDHSNNPQLVYELETKLPLGYRVKWTEWVSLTPERKRNLKDFSEWLDRRVDILCQIAPIKLPEEKGGWREEVRREGRLRKSPGERVMAAADDNKPHDKEAKVRRCAFCKEEGHFITSCTSFSKESTDARWKFVRERKLCFGCLRFGHAANICNSKKTCGVLGCQRSHHKWLHREEVKVVANAQVQEWDEVEAVSHAARSTSYQGQINLNILPVQLWGPKGCFKTLAMLDPGATMTVLDSRMAEMLGVEGEIKPLTFSGLHPSIKVHDSQSVNLDILSADGKSKYKLKNVRTIPNLSFPKQSVKRNLLKRWNHLKNLDIHTYETGRPTILIGQDHLELCNTRELIVGPGNAPAAGRTTLGWVLMGRLDQASRSDYSFFVHEEINDPLHQLVKEHFAVENLGVQMAKNSARSKEDVRSQSIMDSTLKKVSDGWEIGLLWKTEEIQFPPSKQYAMKRLKDTERKMDRDPEFAEKYVAKIDEYINKGFARVLDEAEAKLETPKTFYIPHFMSRNPKKNNKLRFVFDAAAKVDGMSLNDALLVGPDQLKPLPSVLFKFRQRSVGIMADIEDMFHRVHVRKEDRQAQRFLFRGLDRTIEPKVLEMGVLIFGATCSPACAQEVKNKNALLYKDKYPDTYKAIVDRHFVDDFLDSCDDISQAYQRFLEIREVQNHGGFNLCKWRSSCLEFLQKLPGELVATEAKNLDIESQTERVLGLFWKHKEDVFTFNLTYLKAKNEVMQGLKIPSKREVLALVMSIYDPLGFVAHFTVKAKILLQEAWRTKIGWDDEIPKATHDKWNQWLQELKKIPSFQLIRCYSEYFSTADNIQLHIFNDASEQAYGTIAYFRVKKGDQIKVTLVMAKSRVAPLKPLTMPRMELQAALLGSRLAKFIKEEHEMEINQTIYWSDSKTVLSWLRADGKTFHQFVACRVGEIQETTNAQEWNWIPTKLNVADELTRDNSPSDWDVNSRWVNGPDFLKLNEENWPKERSTEKQPKGEDLEEVRKGFIHLLVPSLSIINPTDYSSWNRLIRVTAYVIWIKNYCLSSKAVRATMQPHLGPDNILLGKRYWWKRAQEESFNEEFYLLQQGKQVPKTSKLSNLNVYMDDGIMRLKGRLGNALHLSTSVKSPVVLDSKNQVTRLILNHFHIVGGHHGQERIANEVRQQFHVLNLRAAVRSTFNSCQLCKNNRAQPKIPIMGQLPSCRLEPYQPPFTRTGLDYFGPIEVTVGRRHEKRYGALFTCLSTRAVHVEIAASLTTDSCLMAIRRFAARRGCPSEIYSDNGTNFIGADNELRANLKELNQLKLKDGCCQQGIKWHFIPPLAPHMGGSWERLVKSVKVALYATLKERFPREEVFQTLIAEAEHTVNSHPLTFVSIDPEDQEALTPNHFLLGRSSNLQQVGVFSDRDLCSRKMWRQAQQLSDKFWSRWVHEYLPSLLRRKQWIKEQKSIAIGDIVLEVNPNLSRNSWPKGIVIKVFPGKDGHVRVAEIKTVSGVYKRPVKNLIVLDVRKAEDISNLEEAGAEDLGANAAAASTPGGSMCSPAAVFVKDSFLPPME